MDIVPLTKAAFAPFGDVIETDGAERLMINDGTTERFHNLADIDVGADGGQPMVSIFRGRSWPKDNSGRIEIKMMERHPLGSQAFIPSTESTTARTRSNSASARNRIELGRIGGWLGSKDQRPCPA